MVSPEFWNSEITLRKFSSISGYSEAFAVATSKLNFSCFARNFIDADASSIIKLVTAIAASRSSALFAA